MSLSRCIFLVTGPELVTAGLESVTSGVEFSPLAQFTAVRCNGKENCLPEHKSSSPYGDESKHS